MQSGIESRFAKTSVVTGLSAVLSTGTQLISVPVCLHYWGNERYGGWWRFPAFGVGLGAFGEVFPLVRTLPLAVTFTHAESDWVQLLFDTGAVGLLLALLSVALVARALLRRYQNAESHWTLNFALGGLVALAGAVVQGIANFNLAVMSNFIYLALAVALALRAGRAGENVSQPPVDLAGSTAVGSAHLENVAS